MPTSSLPRAHMVAISDAYVFARVVESENRGMKTYRVLLVVGEYCEHFEHES